MPPPPITQQQPPSNQENNVNTNSNRIHALFVAEKPSMAKTLAEVLGNNRAQRRDGVSRYNPCFDFELNLDQGIQLKNPGPKYKLFKVTMTSVSGHLMGIDFHSSYSNWNSTPQRELFDAPIIQNVTEGSGDLAKNLENEAKKARVLVIWTDCDREGEAIGAEVIAACMVGNPRLVVKRARFSAANRPDVLRAVNSLREMNQGEIDAVSARAEIDLRLGAVFTRFQTLGLRNKIHTLVGKTISFGPCQFPTLGFVVSRYEKILAFRPQEFWSIHLVAQFVSEDASNNPTSGALPLEAGQQSGAAPPQQQVQNPATARNTNTCTFNWQRHRLYDRLCALVVYELCCSRPEAVITNVSRSNKTRFRPLPLSTVELQIRASKWCQLSSEITMKAAESLYQRGIISYPRTETEIFAESYDLRAMISEQRPSPIWGEYASSLLDDSERCYGGPRRGTKDDGAHPPIHPTKFVDVNSLTQDPEKRIYDLIVRHFLASLSKDAYGSDASVTCRVASETFTARGTMVHEKNYLNIYPFEKWSNKTLPDWKEGDVFVPQILELTQGNTTPPSLLTEEDLIHLMDKSGIGTDATMQDHIKTIQERDYAHKLNNRYFQPTDLGLSLVRSYVHLGHERALSKPDVRARMERDLVSICRGVKTKEQVVRETIVEYKRIFLDVASQKDTMFQMVDDGMNRNNNNAEQQPLDPLQRLTSRYTQLLVASGNFSICGTCGENTLELRSDEHHQTRVCSCTNNECDFFAKPIGPLPRNGNFEPQLDGFKCPICRYQVLTVSALIGEETKTYPICPSCYSNPPSAARSNNTSLTDIEETGMIGDLSSLPCYKCSFESCSLAGGIVKVPVLPCSQCDKFYTLRKAKNNSKPYLGCQGYPTCTSPPVWFFRCLKDVRLANSNDEGGSHCLICGPNVRRLVYTFHRTSIPMGTPPEMVECSRSNCSSHSDDYRRISEMENYGGGGNHNGAPRPQGTSTTGASTGRLQGNSGANVGGNYSNNNGGAARAMPTFSSTQTHPSSTRHGPSTSAAVQQQQRLPSQQHQQQNRQASIPHRSTPPTQPQQQRTCPKCGSICGRDQQNGRGFYKCDPCRWSLWIDSAPSSIALPTTTLTETTSTMNLPPSNFNPSTKFRPQQQQPVINCTNCGGRGHQAQQCPSPPEPTSVPTTTIYQQYQHSSTNFSSQASCYKCGQPGHFANACPGGSGAAGAAIALAAPAAAAGGGSNRNCGTCGTLFGYRKRKCDRCDPTTTSTTNAARTIPVSTNLPQKKTKF